MHTPRELAEYVFNNFREIQDGDIAGYVDMSTTVVGMQHYGIRVRPREVMLLRSTTCHFIE